MQSILNSIDSRQISFIEVLFFQDDWITLGTIAEKLDCSEKILRSNINIINNIYAPFQITTSVKRGIRILYPENYNLDFVYSVTLGNSYEFNFLELVFFNESLKKGEMVESLFISPSSLNRIVKKCTAFFSQFGIEIRTSPYQMVGDELKIQNFYVHYFLEKYLLDSSPFEDKELGLINTILDFFLKYYQDDSGFSNKKKLLFSAMTALTRLKNGHVRKIGKISKENEEIIHEILSHTNLVQSFRQLMGIELTKNMLIQLFYVFFHDDYILSTNIFSEKLHNPKVEEDFAIIDQFLESLSIKLGIELQNKELLVLKIYNARNFLFGKNYILHNKKIGFSQHIEQEYPLFSKILKKEIKAASFSTIEKENPSFFNEVLYELIIHWTNLTMELTKSVVSISIGIISDQGTEHAEFIRKLIDYRFGKYISASIIASENLKFNQNKYAMVIATMSYFYGDFFDIPVISINSVPNEHDWKNIQKKLQELSCFEGEMGTKYIKI